MRSQTVILSALLTTAYAQNGGFGGFFKGFFPAQCPTVWKDVATDLTHTFNGCGDVARGAIRAPFHDCVTGACDGSLILGNECSRAENAGLLPTCILLGQKAQQFNVGVADMIEFAAAVAMAVCPFGPRVRALVGRIDNSTASPNGLVPGPRDPMDKILGQFAKVGMSPADVVALVGAHTTARQFFDDPAKAGASLDTTPGVWDVKFYGQTKAGTAPYSLSSDRRMTNDSRTASTWDIFTFDFVGWTFAFNSAWDRFSTAGNDRQNLTDCSQYLPPQGATKRSTMGRPMGYPH